MGIECICRRPDKSALEDGQGPGSLAFPAEVAGGGPRCSAACEEEMARSLGL